MLVRASEVEELLGGGDEKYRAVSLSGATEVSLSKYAHCRYWYIHICMNFFADILVVL